MCVVLSCAYRVRVICKSFVSITLYNGLSRFLSIGNQTPLGSKMALFGDLNQITFAEVVKLLKRRCGSLVIQVHQTRFVLHVNQGHLVGARIDNQIVENRTEANQMLIVLFQSTQGTFVFSQESPEILYNELDLVLDANFSTGSFEDNFLPLLPHPDTFFKQTRKEILSDQLLNNFLEQSQTLLFVGTSANEISQRLKMDVNLVQSYFYRLRLFGLIQPIRKSENEQLAKKPQVRNQKSNLFFSLMSNLRTRIASYI
jgi:hypothetical protein